MADLKSPLRELALFAGAGGGILGGKLLGWRTVCAVEWEPYAACVLAARQNDGLLPPFPIWDDIQTFDGRPWRGIVDVVSGGFPCQDISVAGKGDGLDGERSGMWKHMARVVGEVRPRFVFVENSPMLTSRGGTRVISDLAALGYDTRWTVMGAADVGAPHQRDRLWLVAHADFSGRQAQRVRADQPRDGHETELRSGKVADSSRHGWDEMPIGQPFSSGEPIAAKNISEDGLQDLADTNGQRQQEQHAAAFSSPSRQHPWGASEIGASAWWNAEPDVGRVANGVAARVDRLKAIGNGQVPLCAAEAWRELSELL